MSVDVEEKSVRDSRALPRPVMKKIRWPLALIWLVPLAAAVGAAFYAYDYSQNRGPLLSLTFTDASGIRPADTKVIYRGVEIGEVENITLSDDHQHAVIAVRLQKAQADLARTGTLFWIVRPQISLTGISGLNTLLSGPFIDLLPGTGDPATNFTGFETPPQLPEPGLTIYVRAPRIDHLQQNAPVLYRGIEIGLVRTIKLTADADAVELSVLIEPRYAPLVRNTSVFWLVKGVDVKGGLFSGLQLKLDSLQALIAGGVTFATDPDNLGQPAPNGEEFAIYDEPKSDWLKWTPRITLPPDDAQSQQEENHLPTGADAIRDATKGH